MRRSFRVTALLVASSACALVAGGCAAKREAAGTDGTAHIAVALDGSADAAPNSTNGLDAASAELGGQDEDANVAPFPPLAERRPLYAQRTTGPTSRP